MGRRNRGRAASPGCWRMRPAEVSVVGLVGCSAAGKSTLCDAVAKLLRRRMMATHLSSGALALAVAAAVVAGSKSAPRGLAAAALIAGAAAAAARVSRNGHHRLSLVNCDDYYLPLELCPRFDLSGEIAWPGGAVPEAFAARGNADLNDPAAVDWTGVASAVDRAVLAAAAADAADGRRTLVVLEGLLLLGAGAEAARRRVQRWILLDAPPNDAAAQAELWRRKYTRSGHLGKKSYQERGVSADAYAAYWNDYVARRWREHGLDRLGTVGSGIERLEAVGLCPEVLARKLVQAAEK